MEEKVNSGADLHSVKKQTHLSDGIVASSRPIPHSNCVPLEQKKRRRGKTTQKKTIVLQDSSFIRPPRIVLEQQNVNPALSREKEAQRSKALESRSSVSPRFTEGPGTLMRWRFNPRWAG
ncbi:hypothetical protein Q8A67_025824 [Cirrhinus molitorella]|uniref:Uncharacterized protein n=1 Tax=Cirrhinus molitorella TaxID=172907 RepID=A0AA88NV90_9TELE|nr:hypothetical protein Q8A67_025824 [Cirrhinus molitorella]